MFWFIRGWPWQVGKENFYQCSPSAECRCVQNQKDLLRTKANTYIKYFFVSFTFCHPYTCIFWAFATTRSLFDSQVIQAIDLLLMKWGLIDFFIFLFFFHLHEDRKLKEEWEVQGSCSHVQRDQYLWNSVEQLSQKVTMTYISLYGWF